MQEFYDLRFLFNISLWYSVAALSREGVTQGDPLSMLMYSIAVLPLIHSLSNNSRWHQNWYADDSSCIGVFQNLREWFLHLSEEGPAFGYFPEPLKSTLVVHPCKVLD